RLAEDLVRLGRVPLSGPLTSIGIPSAPHFIYAISPLVALSRDPAVVAGGIALAHIGGIVGALWLGWRWFGPAAGLAVTALFAAPFVLHEIQTRWVDIPNIRYYSSLNTFVDLDSARSAVALSSGLGPSLTAGALPLEHAGPAWLVQATAVVETILLAA